MLRFNIFFLFEQREVCRSLASCVTHLRTCPAILSTTCLIPRPQHIAENRTQVIVGRVQTILLKTIRVLLKSNKERLETKQSNDCLRNMMWNVKCIWQSSRFVSLLGIKKELAVFAENYKERNQWRRTTG